MFTSQNTNHQPTADHAVHDLIARQAEALFASHLSARMRHSEAEIAAAVEHATDAHEGALGCAGAVAAAYGEHPETAAARMRWALAAVAALFSS